MRRAPRLRRLGLLVAMALVAALAAGALWLLISSTHASRSPHHGGRTVNLGAASVSVPSDWAPASARDAGLPELSRAATVFAPAPGLSAQAVIVLRPGGVPAPLRALIDVADRSRGTTVAGLPARTYVVPAAPGGRRAEVTVARTSVGTLTVACIARDASWVVSAGCARLVAATDSTLQSAG